MHQINWNTEYRIDMMMSIGEDGDRWNIKGNELQPVPP
jgi:hypothetical protein